MLDLPNRRHQPRLSSVVHVHPVVRRACIAFHISTAERYEMWKDTLKGIFAKSSDAIFEKFERLRRVPLRDVRFHHAIPTKEVTQEEVDQPP